eukprot:gb/GEZN01014604.1/.p1 GENE.gb/GEZN01014604.1/~~gb/GEZN01014604.1/.p1  ORF type:complete len:274 (-),score=52.05 gb/GEZN01014604.1/:121-894(-)
MAAHSRASLFALLDAINGNAEAAAIFSQCAEKNFAAESWACYQELKKWSRVAAVGRKSKRSNEMLKDNATQIIDRYIKSGSALEVNISGSQRKNVINNFQTSSSKIDATTAALAGTSTTSTAAGVLDANLFAEIQEELKQLLTENVLVKFEKSAEFAKVKLLLQEASDKKGRPTALPTDFDEDLDESIGHLGREIFATTMGLSRSDSNYMSSTEVRYHNTTVTTRNRSSSNSSTTFRRGRTSAQKTNFQTILEKNTQ